jgi:CSLREA domain-containing protein
VNRGKATTTRLIRRKENNMTTTPRLIRRTLLAAAIAALFTAPAGAATITVSTTGDTIANDGVCSLREAVIAANTNTASGVMAGECAAGEAAPTVDVINIPAGTYTLTIAPINNTLAGADPVYTFGEYTLTWNAGAGAFVATVTPDATNGDLDIMESVNLVGANKATTIINAGWVPSGAVNDPAVDPDAGATAGLSDRVLHVVNNAVVTVAVQMSGLTVKGGRSPEVTGLFNAVPVEYYLRFNGGGLAVGIAAGTYNPLTAGEGGAKPVIVSGSGVPGPTYTLGLSNVTITQNYSGDGGGFYNGATTTANLVSISGNRGYANGGGIYNDGGLTLTNSTVGGNGAEGGGGMFDTGSGARTVTGSTFSDNGGVGGGAYSGRSGVTMNITNSTVSGNFARDEAAGLLTNGALILTHVTVANNTTTTDAANAGSGVMTFPSGGLSVTMRGVLLNNNLKGTVVPPTVSADCGATGSGIAITSLGYNLSQDTSCALGDTTDRQSVNAQLVALADNGGPTLTHALPATSIAVNNGGALGSIIVDQRGFARDSMPDIGSFEYAAVAVPATSSGGGGGCFIATAAWGTPMQEDVRYLRAFRDEYLLTNSVGRKFVEAYYSMSPPVADYIREHETLRSVVRTGLRPLVELSRQLVSPEMLATEK